MMTAQTTAREVAETRPIVLNTRKGVLIRSSEYATQRIPTLPQYVLLSPHRGSSGNSISCLYYVPNSCAAIEIFYKSVHVRNAAKMRERIKRKFPQLGKSSTLTDIKELISNWKNKGFLVLDNYGYSMSEDFRGRVRDYWSRRPQV